MAKLPKEMKAQVLREFNSPYDYATIPVPVVTEAFDVVVKVEAAGYCHTDAVYASGALKKILPIVNSHEFAGTVVAKGSRADVAVGSRVGVPGRMFRSCGKCSECLNADEDTPNYSVYCPYGGGLGLGLDGGFQEYALVDSRQLIPLPDSMSAVDSAPMMCAGLTIYGALKRCALKPGQAVGIIGCGGGLGHLGLQFASAMELKVVGIDAQDAGIKLSRELNTGADIFDSRATTPAAVLDSLFGALLPGEIIPERGLDAVIILPESQKAFDFAVGLLKNHSTCVIVSFPAAGFHISALDVVYKDIRIIGSLVATTKQAKEMINFAATHGIKPHTRTYPLRDLNQLVADYHKGGAGKLVVDMSL